MLGRCNKHTFVNLFNLIRLNKGVHTMIYIYFTWIHGIFKANALKKASGQY